MVVSNSNDLHHNGCKDAQPSSKSTFPKYTGRNFHVKEEDSVKAGQNAITSTNHLDMTSCHLPDEYCDPIMSYGLARAGSKDDDDNDTLLDTHHVVDSLLCGDEERQHKHDDPRYVTPPHRRPQVHLDALHHHLQAPRIRDVCSSSSSSLRGANVLFGSLVALFAEGGNNKGDEKGTESLDNIKMMNYDLPEICVDMSVACEADSCNSNSCTSQVVAISSEHDECDDPTMSSLDHLDDIRRVLFPDSTTKTRVPSYQDNESYLENEDALYETPPSMDLPDSSSVTRRECWPRTGSVLRRRTPTKIFPK